MHPPSVFNQRDSMSVKVKTCTSNALVTEDLFLLSRGQRLVNSWIINMKTFHSLTWKTAVYPASWGFLVPLSALCVAGRIKNCSNHLPISYRAFATYVIARHVNRHFQSNILARYINNLIRSFKRMSRQKRQQKSQTHSSFRIILSASRQLLPFK